MNIGVLILNDSFINFCNSGLVSKYASLVINNKSFSIKKFNMMENNKEISVYGLYNDDSYNSDSPDMSKLELNKSKYSNKIITVDSCLDLFCNYISNIYIFEDKITIDLSTEFATITLIFDQKGNSIDDYSEKFVYKYLYTLSIKNKKYRTNKIIIGTMFGNICFLFITICICFSFLFGGLV